ncbi:septum formation family protein [Mycolicibacterium monacense]|uniref:septum formation family protein n=1 Tax=Mycolicibacterium monacense TaxID=85693 RepID=UPI0007EB65D0|nr:septum formation family protein [Mycolicibacterium monacense]OBF53372.1 septum formation family protein [Mycolicibacterium monacense]
MSMPPGPPPPPPGQPPYGQQPYGQPAYGQPAYGQPYFPPPPPQPYAEMRPAGPPPPPKKSKLWLILGLVALTVVVIAIAVVLFVVLVVREGTVTATQVKLGDCLSEIPDGSEVRTLKTVDCAEPHAGEVFAVLQMPEGDFPGQDAMVEYANRCAPELASYSPAAVTDDTVRLFVLFPTDETWSDGDRAVTCVATLNPPRAGSLKG